MGWNKDSINDLRLKMGLTFQQLAIKLNCKTEDLVNLEVQKLNLKFELISNLDFLKKQIDENDNLTLKAAACEDFISQNELQQIQLNDLENFK